MAKDIFRKIASSSSSAGGNYFRQGRGALVIQKIFIKDSAQKGATFIAEFLVKSSESYPDAVDRAGKAETANAPGTTVSYIQQLEQFDSAPGNTKAFIEALVGNAELSEEDFIGLLKEIVNEDPSAKDSEGNPLEVNPMRGVEVRYATYQKPIQKGPHAGKLLTLPRWEHVETSDETKTANRANLDGKVAA